MDRLATTQNRKFKMPTGKNVSSENSNQKTLPSSPKKDASDSELVLPEQHVHAGPNPGEVALVLNTQPIKLVVDSSTDWPVVWSTAGVGAGSALIALVVGIMAYQAQRRQARSATANFRKEWQAQLRDAISKFVSVAMYVSEELDQDEALRDSRESKRARQEMVRLQMLAHLLQDAGKPDHQAIIALTRDQDHGEAFRDTRESKRAYQEMVQAQALIHLLLDARKTDHQAIVDLTRDLVVEIWDNKRDNVSDLLQRLITASGVVLDQTWQEMKKDVA